MSQTLEGYWVHEDFRRFHRHSRRVCQAAPPENCIDGTPIVSFPFYIDALDPAVQFLHWEFVDPDSIPVCGFQWNHWSLANLPVDALMYDFNDSHALAIPADFSRTVSAMILKRFRDARPPPRRCCRAAAVIPQ